MMSSYIPACGALFICFMLLIDLILRNLDFILHKIHKLQKQPWATAVNLIDRNQLTGDSVCIIRTRLAHLANKPCEMLLTVMVFISLWNEYSC